MTQPIVQFKIVDPRLGQQWPLPAYGSDMAAGLDLRAMLDETVSLAPGAVMLIGAGMAIHIGDASICAVILPRSGLGHKQGLVLGNLVGLIDADYQGELKMSAWNRSSSPIQIAPGDRIAQLVFLPVIHPSLEMVSDFEQSARGHGGFGHTGVA
jgi:dUTP pyrophosphatase